MPKRTSGKQESDSKAVREGREGFARETESHAVLRRAPIDEEANQRALDEAAGVADVRRSSLVPPVTRPANAMPLLKADTKEKRLYQIACTGTPLGAEFFDEFPDMKEILDLALIISSRLMVVAACNADLGAPQRIAAIRVLAALAGKLVPDPEEVERFKGAPSLAIPRGSKEEVANTLDKIRQLSQ
jgi:hypothetical protein